MDFFLFRDSETPIRLPAASERVYVTRGIQRVVSKVVQFNTPK